MRTVEERDWPSWVEVHRSAFQPSRFREDVYAFVRSTPAYRADLDCVVEAPDGSIAAYTLAWFDEVNAVGQFEPVGVHADHRRLGLGRAVGLYALRRLRELGATLRARRLPGRRGVPDPGEALRVDRLPRGLAVLGVSVARCVKLVNLVRLAPNQILGLFGCRNLIREANQIPELRRIMLRARVCEPANGA